MTYFDFMRVVNYKRNGNDYCPIAAARLLEEVKERDMKILENEKIKLGWVKEEKVEKVERVVKKVLDKLGIEDYSVKLNNRKILKGLAELKKNEKT